MPSGWRRGTCMAMSPALDIAERPALVGRVAAVEPDGTGSVLVVDTTHGRLRLTVAARPDAALARRLTGGLRRVRWVRVAGSPLGTTCELVGAAHRNPVQRPLPLSAALALAVDGVPTVVTG